VLVRYKKSFTAEDELVDWAIRMYSSGAGERMASKIRYYKHMLLVVLRRDSSPIFTHNDLQRKDVMVKPDGELCIIDWEYALRLLEY